MNEQELLEYLNEYIDYNPDTGILIWKKKPNNRISLGGEVGSKNKDSYIRLKLKGRKYYAHRIAWLITYGSFPENGIDHINGIKYDNRIINLRDVKQLENCKNKAKHSNNTSGFTGVVWHKASSKWQARIDVNGKRKHLGIFDNLDEAIKVRKEAEKKYGFHENHGR